ncbi:MAG: hypothetical protein P1U85_17615 [Verrucomicrobiales bacterium]|nr:hypothetical protein [Verrucomicrobiales bacterium]
MRSRWALSSRTAAILGLAAFLGLLLLPGVHFPRGRWIDALWNLLHAPTFFAITWILFVLLLPVVGKRAGLAFSAILSIAIGAGVELIQGVIGRSCSGIDLAIDVVGVLLAVLWLCQRGESNKPSLRFLGTCLVAGWLCLAPAWGMDLAEHLHRKHFPEIGGFDRFFSQFLWRSQGNADVSFVREDGSMVVNIEPGAYGGVSYWPNGEDWSASQFLGLGIENPGGTFLLGIRVDDAESKSGDATTWFSAEVEVMPGENIVRIPLGTASPRQGERKQGIDFTGVTRLVLFTTQESELRSFFVDSAFLSR